MTSGFYKKYDIGKYSSADLYYDKEVRAVAIKFFTDIGEGSFKVKHRNNGKGGYISALSFIKTYGLEEFFGKRAEPKVYHDNQVGELFVLNTAELE